MLLSKSPLTIDPSNVNQNNQNNIFLRFPETYSLWRPCTCRIFFWFAHNTTHDIRIRVQCIDFKKNLDTIPTFKSSKKLFSDACRNTYFLGRYYALSNLLRWHPTVLRMTNYYVRTWTFQLDYLVDKSNNRTYLLNHTILIPY